MPCSGLPPRAKFCGECFKRLHVWRIGGGVRGIPVLLLAVEIQPFRQVGDRECPSPLVFDEREGAGRRIVSNNSLHEGIISVRALKQRPRLDCFLFANQRVRACHPPRSGKQNTIRKAGFSPSGSWLATNGTILRGCLRRRMQPSGQRSSRAAISTTIFGITFPIDAFQNRRPTQAFHARLLVPDHQPHVPHFSDL